MKKIIAILVLITFLFSAAALAEDLSALTDEELFVLHQNVLNELGRRGFPVDQEEDLETAAVEQRILSFFTYWNVKKYDEMLALCDSGWKATVEDPRMELFRILANRVPLTMELEAVNEIAGEGPDGLTYCMVTATSLLDRSNGTAPETYRIQFLVRQEKDGLWYIDPSGFRDCEKTEEEIPAEATAEPAGDADADMTETVLYYQQSGGQYYHLDQNCKCVNPKFLPLQGVFTYSELNDEPYRDLKPCEICGAPFAPEDKNRSSDGN